jgi:hypothetical protein
VDPFHLFKAIVHLTLKSFYEKLRQLTLQTQLSSNQIYLDTFYLYSIILLSFYFFTKQVRSKVTLSTIDFQQLEHLDELHNLSGLINEIITVT